MLLFLMVQGISAQDKEKDEEKKFGAKISGFVKNDFFYDTRQTVAAREGHFLLWPSPENLDMIGEDINAQSNFNMLAIQSRISLALSGPDALGAKTSGLIEGDFFALGGLSDSANFSVFYENDHISTRVSYNWRDEFFNGGVNNGSPVFTEAYSQLDANLSWMVNDSWTVFFEGYNLTSETQRTYARYSEMFLRGNQWGSRYSIGASYRF